MRPRRLPGLALAATLLGALVALAAAAPEFLPPPDLAATRLPPWEAPPFGTDERGIPLWAIAAQGAQIVAVPAVVAALVVAAAATAAGLLRCSSWTRLDGAVQFLGELVGALPRMVVILVVAVLVPRTHKSLMPVALTWALLAAPGAMDEAAAAAARLGGARFVEALRAHGFSATRILLGHVVWGNLRPVLVRQAAETAMHVVFLEIALSYLTVRESEPSLTHLDSEASWATLLYQGYASLLGERLWHGGALGLLLIGLVALAATSVRHAARAR
jgi:ABC-type dipeptide/oligopeptide/nickel transport system permease subunit